MLKINKLYVDNVKIKYFAIVFLLAPRPLETLVFTAVVRCLAVCDNSANGLCFIR